MFRVQVVLKEEEKCTKGQEKEKEAKDSSGKVEEREKYLSRVFLVVIIWQP